MKPYKHIFFDLDRTLWDFDKNSAQTLREAMVAFKLDSIIKDFNSFINQFNIHNEYVWNMYKQKKMDKDTVRFERFRLSLEPYNITNRDFINSIQDFYIKNTPLKRNLIDDCIDVLEYLYKKYSLYIVSNGFYDNQLIKMQSSQIDRFFKKIFTSDRLGCAKPDKKIFEFAIKSVNAKKTDSLFVGDDPVNDIEGPKNFGIDQVWLNTEGLETDIELTFTIRNLNELKIFL